MPGVESAPMRIRRTTTFRLTAMLGLAFLCAMIVLLGLIYVLTERELVGRTDDLLQFQARALAAAPAARLAPEVAAAIRGPSSHLDHFALIEIDGRESVGDFIPPPGLRPQRPVEVAATPARGPALRVLALRSGDGRLVVVARDISQIADLRRRVLTILATSGIIAIAMLVLAAVGLSAAPLRRVRTLTALATRIAAGELTLRMPQSERGDELDVIAATVNGMIEEIARLLAQVKGATDAIAHDLRAPLARLHGELEVIRQKAEIPSADTPALVALIERAIGDLDMVLNRFSALLRIAELQATGRQAAFGDFDPMTLAGSVCELFEPLAEERGIGVVLSGKWGHIIRGDEKLLFEVLGNLVENAIKFIPEGGTITVGVISEGAPVLFVRDNGPGIPVAERASVLRRYYRGSAAQHAAGSGLGLSLVAEIVHLHGFTLELEDAGPGLEVRIICQAPPTL